MVELQEIRNSLNPKVYTFEDVIHIHEVIEATVAWKKGEQPISALVTGCFDVLHVDQIYFLQKVKRLADIVVVGVDQDITVALKGHGKPIFGLPQRCEMLASLECVDLVFPVPFALNSYEASGENNAQFTQMTKDLFRLGAPTAGVYSLATNELADPFWEEKKSRAEHLNINYMGLKLERRDSSTGAALRMQSGQ